MKLMAALDTFILLLHPIIAVAILASMWWQYGWKRKSRQLKGETRRQEIERHEKVGERILIAAIISGFPNSTTAESISFRSNVIVDSISNHSLRVLNKISVTSCKARRESGLDIGLKSSLSSTCLYY